LGRGAEADGGAGAVSESPVNLSTTVTRALYVDGDGLTRICDLDALTDREGLEWARPVRRFCAWPGKRSFDGWWWSSTTRTLLPFESLLERQAVGFDSDPAVVGMSVQPFALLWPRLAALGPRWHVPNLFLPCNDGWRGGRCAAAGAPGPTGEDPIRADPGCGRTRGVALPSVRGLAEPRSANPTFLALDRQILVQHGRSERPGRDSAARPSLKTPNVHTRRSLLLHIPQLPTITHQRPSDSRWLTRGDRRSAPRLACDFPICSRMSSD